MSQLCFRVGLEGLHGCSSHVDRAYRTLGFHEA